MFFRVPLFCSGYGAVLSIVSKSATNPTVDLSWVLESGFETKWDTITAICQLALAGGFLDALQKAVLCEYCIAACRWMSLELI